MATETPAYFLENDKEAKRLRQNHECMKNQMGGKLIVAPLDLKQSDLRILDTGTSDGKHPKTASSGCKS